MAGLLDIFDTEGGRLGLGLLAAGSARSDGAGAGQRLMEAFGSVDSWKKQQQAALEAKQMQEYRAMQMEQMKAQAETAKQRQEQEVIDSGAVRGAFTPMSGGQAMANGQGPTLENALNIGQTPQFDPRQFLSQNPQASVAALKQAMELSSSINPKKKFGWQTVDGNLVRTDEEGSASPVFTAAPKPEKIDPNKPFMIVDGKIVPNEAYQSFELKSKRAGATNVTTKVENKMGESLAAQVGPMVKDTYTQAQGAVQQADAANRIIQAVDGGKIIAGPLAGGRMKVAQIGQMLGVTGKDEAEVIARSRDVIRGLSELTLQGRKQMTGQGAITESESKLAEKAMSGDIADLTPAEIRQLAAASARVARFNYDTHQTNLQNLSQDHGTAGLAKFYKVAPFPSANFGSPQSSGGVVNWGDLK